MGKKHLNSEICALRLERLDAYRNPGYGYLADAIRASADSHAELELLDKTTADGKEFQIEVTAFWDDQPGHDIRVVAEAFPVPLKLLLGFIPISISCHPTDQFVMRRDGSIVDE